ncbi:MAG: hypothetical protein ABIP55_01015 [Tepidisphaeraceae bacterium]
MQIVMWLILAATVGLAAIVSSVNRRANRVELSPQSVSAGDVTVRLPLRWRAQPRGDDPRIVARAIDAALEEEARIIEVLCDTLPLPRSPLQYIAELVQFPPDLLSSAGGEDDEVLSIMPVTVAGQAGVLVSIDAMLLGRGTAGLPQKDVYACAVLPSQRVVVVHLRGLGGPDVNDRVLVQQIAKAISVKNEPKTNASRVVLALPGGLSLAPPEGFALIEERDVLRTDRRMWPVAPKPKSAGMPEHYWATLEVVECFFSAPASSPESTGAADAALLTLLLVRDPAWRGAVITRDAPDTWRAQMADAADPTVSDFPARAYLRTGPGGRALLAIFRGGVEAADFDPAWKQLAASIQFGPSHDLAMLEATGAAAAARLRDIGYETLLAQRDEQWWLFTDNSDRPHRAWSNVDLQPAELRGKSELRLRQSGGRITRISGAFSRKDADGLYESDVTCNEAGGGRTHVLQQSTQLRGGQITILARTPARPLGQWKMPAPPQFVPGALLPLVMDDLFPAPASDEADVGKVMLLRSESFVGFEAVATPLPIAIVVRAVANPSRKAEGEDQPMRCLEAEVNGSGVVSRWYFRASGEVECVEFPGGMQRVSSDSKAIRFDFGSEGLMAP